jgi:hypothetical protein
MAPKWDTDTSGATRGDLAAVLFEAMGLTEASSSGKFGDGGFLDGITSTLSDMGITNGIGGGQFGTAQQTTRGQAFTMLARALGFADQNTSIEDAAAALVQAGVVQGLGDDPSNLGLDQPIRRVDLQTLMSRVPAQLAMDRGDGVTISSAIETQFNAAAEAGQAATQQAQAATDPAYAAFLMKQNVGIDNIDADIKERQSLYQEDARLRSAAYQRQIDSGASGISTDFENRGLTRSGARGQAMGRSSSALLNQASDETAGLFAAKEAADKQDNRARDEFVASGGVASINSSASDEAEEAEGQY